MKLREKIKFRLENARYYALGQSLWAGFVATIMGIGYPQFSFKYAIIAIFGVLMAHLSVNLLDDYFDFKSGSVEKRNQTGEGVRSGKCQYIIEGKATLRQLFVVAIIFGVLACLSGGYLFYYRGAGVLICAALGAILGFFYSAPPLNLSYKGFGELVVGIMFGPLLMNGVFYCATGTLSLQLLLLSFAIGSLVTNILYVHSLMDMKTDTASNKKTLAILLPNNVLRLIALVFFAFYPYWIIFIGIIRYKMPEFLFLTFVTIPLSVFLIKLMIEYLHEEKKNYQPKFWMGKMEHWEKIKAIGIDWFMIRWFLSRNIMIHFSALVCVGYILKVVM